GSGGQRGGLFSRADCVSKPARFSISCCQSAQEYGLLSPIQFAGPLGEAYCLCPIAEFCISVSCQSPRQIVEREDRIRFEPEDLAILFNAFLRSAALLHQRGSKLRME